MTLLIVLSSVLTYLSASVLTANLVAQEFAREARDKHARYGTSRALTSDDVWAAGALGLLWFGTLPIILVGRLATRRRRQP